MKETKSKNTEEENFKINQIKEKSKKEGINLKKNKENKNEEDIQDYSDNNMDKALNVSQLLFKTIKNTSSVFLLSSTTTILNFLCNIPLLHVISKESFGTVKVYFELAFSLINYIPRETIRRTSQKFCPDKDPLKEKEKYILTSQLNMIIIIIFSIIGIIIYFCFVFFTNSKQLHENLIQLIIYILCGLLELLCEPIILYMNLKVENKYIPITASSFSRIISNTILAVFFKLDLWSFTISRIIGSLVYLLYILYLGYFKYKLNFLDFIPKDIRVLIRGKIKNDINIEYLRAILFQFVRLNLLNLIIENCEGVILSFVIKNSEEEKSEYSFVSQNFALLLRFFYEPITDGFYILVNKIKYMEKKVENKNIIEEVDINNYNSKNNKIGDEKTENEESSLEKRGIPEDMMDIKIEESYQKEINKEKTNIKEPNIYLTLKVLQLFMKIFLSCGIILIAYYIIYGITIIELIYGKKWANYNIDKIGDSYVYYVVIYSIFDIVESFANATNNSRQMNFSYISLIINSFLLILFMYLFSMWDICGLIMADELSSLLIINSHLFVVFCGKKEKKLYENNSNSIFGEIRYFQKMCFVGEKSLITSTILITATYYIKKIILANSSLIIICCVCGFFTLVNTLLIFIFEYKQFKVNLEEIKSYN